MLIHTLIPMPYTSFVDIVSEEGNVYSFLVVPIAILNTNMVENA